jgi:hypothetical protein
MLTFPLASGCGGTTYEKKKRKKKRDCEDTTDVTLCWYINSVKEV